MIREVLKMGDARLLRVAAPVAAAQFDSEELRALLQDMRDTMAHLNGAGLAAPQIGVDLRVVIFGVHSNPRYPRAEDVPDTVLINPVITALASDTEEDWEGCLSVPGYRGSLTRSLSVTVKALNEEGREIRLKSEDDLLAQALEHETDHVNGILYVDRLDAQTDLIKLELAPTSQGVGSRGRDEDE